MLITCAGLSRPSQVARGWLNDLAYGPPSLQVAQSASVAIPDFAKDTTLLMVLRLTTATCSPLLHRAFVIGDASDKGAQARQQRDEPPPQFDVDNATCATRGVRMLMDDWMATPGKTSPGLQDTCWRAGRPGMRKSSVAYVGASLDGVPISTDATAILLPSASGRRRVTTQRAVLRNCPLRAVKQLEKWCRRSIQSLMCIGYLARQPATVTMLLVSWLCARQRLLSTSKRYWRLHGAQACRYPLHRAMQIRQWGC
jgi:hypothetical protein